MKLLLSLSGAMEQAVLALCAARGIKAQEAIRVLLGEAMEIRSGLPATSEISPDIPSDPWISQDIQRGAAPDEVEDISGYPQISPDIPRYPQISGASPACDKDSLLNTGGESLQDSPPLISPPGPGPEAEERDEDDGPEPLPPRWCERVWEVYLTQRKECFQILGRPGSSPPKLCPDARKAIRNMTRRQLRQFDADEALALVLDAPLGMRWSDWHMGSGKFAGDEPRLNWSNVFMYRPRLQFDQVQTLAALARAKRNGGATHRRAVQEIPFEQARERVHERLQQARKLLTTEQHDDLLNRIEKAPDRAALKLLWGEIPAPAVEARA
jgi:hypothetical protein